MLLEKHSPQPLHVQFENIVRGKIENEDWPPNSIIPSENELSKIYGISRMTVRGVLNRIVAAGLLKRVPGKGTFVAEGKIEGQPLSYLGIREQLEQMGFETTTKILGIDTVEATSRMAKLLELRVGDPVYKLSRVRYLKGLPLSLHVSFLPRALTPYLETKDLLGAQLCDILKYEYHHPIIRQIETLESVLPSTEEAAILDVTVAFPLLRLENFFYTTNNVPMEYSRVVFRGDKIKIRMEYGSPAK
ncbi:MAG: GntR family transcriptional regulator [Planctomycetaceae bacterium]|nr:GntR family transcriptional regulator [Planctomycetaceae bacterium]